MLNMVWRICSVWWFLTYGQTIKIKKHLLWKQYQCNVHSQISLQNTENQWHDACDHFCFFSVLRKRLASIFSACVLSRPCSSGCSHQHKKVDTGYRMRSGLHQGSGVNCPRRPHGKLELLFGAIIYLIRDYSLYWYIDIF